MNGQRTLDLEFPERVDDGSLWVPGTPRGKGSANWIAKCVKGKWIAVQVSDKAAKRNKAWEAKVAANAWQWWGPEETLKGAVAMHLDFYFLRPANHWGTGRNAGKLKDWAPREYFKKPDPDKLARAVLDALGGTKKRPPIVYKDDCQVDPLSIARHYCGPENPDEGVRIYLRGEIDGETIGFMPELKDA